MEPQELYNLYGRVVLMCGNETLHWTPADVAKVADFCAARGIDSMSVKVADGTIVWHDGPTVQQMRQVAKEKGVGFVPFIYIYGPRFGDEQIRAEASLVKAMMQANENAGCIVDMESEWNGQADAAALFASEMRDKPGPLVISTWADPSLQNWGGVLDALRPVADLIGPQQYTDFLGTCEGQFPSWCVLAPEINLSQSFGPNNQHALALQARNRGHNSLWLWYEGYAMNNQGLVADLVAIMKQEMPPAPPPAPSGTYTVQPGDSLWKIAGEQLHDVNRWHEIYALNQQLIGSNPGLILPGQVLTLPAA